MKIVKLSAENIKRLHAVEIVPDGNVVVIAGRNGQGKSSVLDSIWFALGGGAAVKDTPQPVREGEERAVVELDLDDLVVTRVWKNDTTTLAVKAADGAKYSSPQSMLDALVGRLSFDPLAFAQQPAKEQLATLLSLVDLPFDVDELDRKRAGLYDARTEVGRTVREVTAQLAGIPEVEGDLPAQEISIQDLLARRQAAVEQVADNDEKRRERTAIGVEIEKRQQRLEALAAEIAAVEQEMSELRTLAADVDQILDEVEDPDVSVFDQRLATLDETNKKIRARNAYADLCLKQQHAVAEQERLTEQIAAIDQQKTDAIAAAKMPIDGLGFDADGVLYQGIPFKQASSAEQLRVSVAMAMALNPEVRVIRIADGSLLDSENLALIAQMADDRDYQVWIERVDESGEVGVVIEDGAVRQTIPDLSLVPSPQGVTYEEAVAAGEDMDARDDEPVWS